MKRVLKKLKCKKREQVRNTVKNTSFHLYILRIVHSDDDSDRSSVNKYKILNQSLSADYLTILRFQMQMDLETQKIHLTRKEMLDRSVSSYVIVVL